MNWEAAVFADGNEPEWFDHAALIPVVVNFGKRKGACGDMG